MWRTEDGGFRLIRSNQSKLGASMVGSVHGLGSYLLDQSMSQNATTRQTLRNGQENRAWPASHFSPPRPANGLLGGPLGPAPEKWASVVRAPKSMAFFALAHAWEPGVCGWQYDYLPTNSPPRRVPALSPHQSHPRAVNATTNFSLTPQHAFSLRILTKAM